MLEISEQTHDRFESDSYARFETRAYQFVREHFPEAVVMAGENGTRLEIHRAVQRASMNDFATHPQALKYIYMHYLLGRDFDVDPGHAWVGSILRDRRRTPDDRLDDALDAIDRRAAAGHEMRDPGGAPAAATPF